MMAPLAVKRGSVCAFIGAWGILTTEKTRARHVPESDEQGRRLGVQDDGKSIAGHEPLGGLTA